jgi:ABC-type transport system involved in multi-copper enzyme maturation permease subunit
MITLALTGALLIGNDFTHGSVPFYLAKPLSRWHYLLGKFLAVGVVVNMLTTVPALLLFLQKGSSDYDYLLDPDFFLKSGTGHGPAGLPLLLGILGYGLLLSVFLSIMLVAVASRMRRTVPLILAWTTIFLFCRRFAALLVDGLQMNEHWRLLDLWNSLQLVGSALLQIEPERRQPLHQPETWTAALVLTVVTLLCLIYLNQRTRAVEVVK